MGTTIPFQADLSVLINPVAYRPKKARPAIQGVRYVFQTPKCRTAFFLFFLFLLVLFHETLWAEGSYLLEGNGIRILFEPSQESVARDLVQIYPEVREELRQTLRWDLALNPSVRLVQDTRIFRRWVESPLTVAFAVPAKRLVVMDASRMNVHPFTLRNTFKHELCHLLLHRHIESDRLPRWLDEGIAQWVSDGALDILLDQKRSVLNRIALRGRFIPLASLTRGFPRNDQAMILAYEESRSFIDYLIGISGTEGVLTLLQAMKEGDPVEDAVFKAYALSLGQLEREWQRSLKDRMSWFTFLSYYLYEILFVLAALMSVYGFIRIMIRKRRRMKEDMGE
ncbi:MAG: hypothetical protein J7M32_12115 [Deltaproteobacteria bacterium]|nr:hypothetical protein [Deltaproteobacteria bacterium]